VVHVQDVVDGIVRALVHGERSERYILGGENVTYLRINEIIAECYRLRRTFVPVPRVVTGVGAMIMEPLGALVNKQPRFTYDLHYFAHRSQFYDSSKATKELGYTARSFKEIVQDYMLFAQANIPLDTVALALVR
jgi:dihydroflavonol-4-reductase